jgi:putative transposase
VKTPLVDAELTLVTAEQWEEARRILPVVRELSANPNRTRAQVVAAAAALGCGPTHLYALVRRYSADRRLTSLLPQRPGPDRGYSRLTAEVEALVDARSRRFISPVNALG